MNKDHERHDSCVGPYCIGYAGAGTLAYKVLTGIRPFPSSEQKKTIRKLVENLWSNSFKADDHSNFRRKM